MGLNTGFQVMPNPFRGFVNIEIDNFKNEKYYLKIIGAMRREILLQKIISQKSGFGFE
jgi:hypothetical protein